MTKLEKLVGMIHLMIMTGEPLPVEVCEAYNAALQQTSPDFYDDDVYPRYLETVVAELKRIEVGDGV